MTDQTTRERIDFVAAHIASRKDWGAYVELMTQIRRTGVAQADEFLEDIGRRLERALRAPDTRPDA